MQHITAPDAMTPQFAVPGPTELYDESGQPLGLFVPKARTLSG